MKVHVFAPNLVIDVILYCFEAAQMLVRLRRNYFCGTDFLIRSRLICFAHDGQRALIIISICIHSTYMIILNMDIYR